MSATVRTVFGMRSLAAAGSTVTVQSCDARQGLRRSRRVWYTPRASSVILHCDPALVLRRKSSIAPCLPRPANEPPVGPGWIREIKHDGFRIMARRRSVRLFTRNGYNFADRFPLIAKAVEALPIRSCFIDVRGDRGGRQRALGL
jgi:bifunctional non-homologous end joining protein LigD